MFMDPEEKSYVWKLRTIIDVKQIYMLRFMFVPVKPDHIVASSTTS